jgi:hypothetical protein
MRPERKNEIDQLRKKIENTIKKKEDSYLRDLLEQANYALTQGDSQMNLNSGDVAILKLMMLEYIENKFDK